MQFSHEHLRDDISTRMTSLKLTRLRTFFSLGTSSVSVSSCPFGSHYRWVGLSILPPCILIIQISNVLLCCCNDDVTMSGKMHENGAHGCKATSISLIVELKIFERIGHFISLLRPIVCRRFFKSKLLPSNCGLLPASCALLM